VLLSCQLILDRQVGISEMKAKCWPRRNTSNKRQSSTNDNHNMGWPGKMYASQEEMRATIRADQKI
jgi:hypothetical protein